MKLNNFKFDKIKINNINNNNNFKNKIRKEMV